MRDCFGGGEGLDMGMVFRKNKKGRLVWVQYNNTRFLHGDTLARRPRRLVCMYVLKVKMESAIKLGTYIYTVEVYRSWYEIKG